MSTGVKYVVPMENGKFFRPTPEEFPDTGFLVYRDDDGYWTWLYREPGMNDEPGPRFVTRAAAILSVADEWVDAGGSYEWKFVSTTRAYATRVQKEEA